MMKARLRKHNDRRSSLAGCFVARTHARRIPRASTIIIVCWFFFNVFPKALSLSGESVEYPVKLAFLYNFAKFVEWPADSYSNPGAPLSICIVGLDPFGSAIEGELQTRKAWAVRSNS
jgi:hypothetical protein